MLRHTYRKLLIFFGLFILVPIFSEAAQLKMMSDLISNPEPNASASHKIEFVNTNDIGAGGEIRLSFIGKNAPFVFPPLFDFSNIGLEVSKGSGYEQYVIDSFSDAATSSASLIPIGDGEIRIRLAYNDEFSIPMNSKIRVLIGGNALSMESIVNPNAANSHLISINTFDSSNELIDSGKLAIVTMNPIGMRTGVKGSAAIISNGLPKGLLPGGTKKVFVSAETNIPSFCRYSPTPDVLYENMLSGNLFKSQNFNRLHYFVMDVVDDHAYKLYVRCFTKYGLEANTEDYLISFEVGVIPKEVRPPPPPPGTQAGSNRGGGNMLPQSGLIIDGRTFPSASVVILKDGKDFKTVSADQQGNFSADVPDIDRGTYNFMVTALNDKLRSASYNTTVYINGSSRNTIGPVFLSPTVTSKTQQIDVGSQVLVTGRAVPLMLVQAVVVGPKDPLQQPYVVGSTTANGSGEWAITLNTTKLPRGTYAVLAQTIVPGQGNSQFSPEFLVGIGMKPEGNSKRRADLNGDGKVNIADLSMLLFNWKKSSPIADINMDGTVNITDFSIMLSLWTA